MILNSNYTFLFLAMYDYEEVNSIGSSPKEKGFFSRMRNSYASYKKWKFARFHFNRLKLLELPSLLTDDIGRLVFDKYIKDQRDLSHPGIKRYWYGYLLSRRIQGNKLLVMRPGIKHQLIELTRNFKWKEDVVRIIFEFEMGHDKKKLHRFLRNWERAMLCGIQISKVSFDFIRDLNSGSEIIKDILKKIYEEKIIIDQVNKRE